MYKNLSDLEIKKITDSVNKSTLEEIEKMTKEENSQLEISSDLNFQMEYINRYSEYIDELIVRFQKSELTDYQKAACLCKALLNVDTLKKDNDQKIERKNGVIAFKSAIRLIDNPELVNDEEAVHNITRLIMSKDFDVNILAKQFERMYRVDAKKIRK